MLAPRSANAFVCLRCELQLSRRLPTLRRPTSYANFSAYAARRRNGAAETEARSEAAASAALRIRRQIQPHNKVILRGGKVIREESKKLKGLARLGYEAEILVLKEIGDTTPKKPEAEVATEIKEPQEAPDILASLQEEKETLTPEEIHERLESLRPKSDVVTDGQQLVSQAKFVDLIKSLTHGLTSQQLSRYYSAAKNIEQDKIPKEVLGSLTAETRAANSPIVRSEWQPGTTPIARRLPGIDLARKSKLRPVGKYLLVDRILRDVWKLAPLEEIESEGEIELLLKPWQVALLNAGDESPLAKIRQTRKVKLEVHLAQGVLRITSDKTTAEYAANDVEEALQKTEVTRVELEPWTKYLVKSKVPGDGMLAPLYTQEDFDMIASLSGVSIQRMDNKNTLVIRAPDINAAAEAERALIRLLPLRDSTAHTIDYHKISPHRTPQFLVPTYYDEKSLEHKSRNMELGRWSDLTASSTGSSDKQHKKDNDRATSSGKLVEKIVTTVGSIEEKGAGLQAQRSQKRDVGYWRLDPDYKLSAEFGLVLGPIQKVVPKDEGESASLETTFLPSFPGLAGLLTSNHFQADGATETPALLYSFVALPVQKKLANGQRRPNLHIQMRTGRKGNPATLDELSLEFQERTHDLLLPSSAADIRFRHVGRLLFPTDHPDKNIKKWVDAVCANIASGARLTAPSLTIQIPVWTLPGSPAKQHGMVAVTYLFSSVQFRQSVIGQVDGIPASYSTVQSDKLGARGASFKMHYGDSAGTDKVTQSEKKEKKGGLKGFIEKCFKTVDRITEAAGQTQPVSKFYKPRSEDSARQLNRLDAQSAQAAGGEFSPTPDAVKEGEDLVNDIESLFDQGPVGAKDAVREVDIFDSVPDKNQARIENRKSHAAVAHSAAENTADPRMSSVLAFDEPNVAEERDQLEDKTDEDDDRLLRHKG